MNDLRSLPKVDSLRNHESLTPFPDAVRTRAAREAIDAARETMRQGRSVNLEEIPIAAARHALELSLMSLDRVINASGIILHTGLGRARLAPSVAEHVARVAAGHASLEYNVEQGSRGNRQDHVRGLLCELTGAEDALVVNNAAAAVFLTLSALCKGKNVVLSRGQMVEIGGSFRMPDVIRESGCHLLEVGCTNKTHLSDYEDALGEEPGAILRCHPSNFRIVGFTEEPSLADLAGLARAKETLLIDDQGNGCLVDLRQYSVPYEPTLPDSVAGGADVSIASGDKLLGGPQAGLIVGKKDLIAKIAKHPVARAVRIDKLSLAALEATLRLYRDGRQAEIPTLAAMARSLDDVEQQAKSIAQAVPMSRVAPGFTEVGAGSAPGTGIPTWRVGIPGGPDKIAQSLRTNDIPIIGRIEDGVLWLDPRTVDESETPAVEAALKLL